MQALSVPHLSERWSWPGRAGRPSPRRLGALAVLLIAVVVAGAVGSTIAYLRLPAPTGAYGVGRATALLTDPGRAEPRAAGGDRQVGIVAWYPATAGSGEPAGYVPDLERLRDGLAASGEIAPLAIAGLDAIQASARTGAELAVAARDGTTGFPVVLLSPGNATNVAFYGSLAEDLASRGYVVIGVDHPYQVAAVALDDGAMAVYEGDAAAGRGEGGISARIEERVADLGYVLDRLTTGAGVEALDGHLDLNRVAVVGHSNGGLAAAELCRRDVRVQACVNLDGQAAGGPLGTTTDAGVPDQPFLFVTKETRLHPTLAARFEAGGAGTFRVVIPSATHAAFTDGPRFEPRLAPVDGTADHVLALERGFVGAFLDHTLRGAPATVFSELAAPADVYVEVYPLGGRPTLPTGTP